MDKTSILRKWSPRPLQILNYFYMNYNFLFVHLQMAKRQSWNSEEDNLITELISSYEKSNKKIKWTEISDFLKDLNPNWKRTGKQCRQRWLNHLKPLVNKSADTHDFDLKFLFSLIRVHGKKWATIAKQLPSSTDNGIKNFFYASLRKGLRNLNVYNAEIRECKRYKVYKLDLIDKILSVHDEKKNKNLYIVDSSVFDLTHSIRENIIQCSLIELKATTELTKELEFYYEGLNDKVIQFCRICKFKKSKGKKIDEESDKYEVFTRKLPKKSIQDEAKLKIEQIKSEDTRQTYYKIEVESCGEAVNDLTTKNSQGIDFQMHEEPNQSQLYVKNEYLEIDVGPHPTIILEQDVIKIEDNLFQSLSKAFPGKTDLNYLLY